MMAHYVRLMAFGKRKRRTASIKVGIVRSTFIIEKQGNLIGAEYGAKADGHA